MFRELALLLPYTRRYRWHYAVGSVCIVASILFKFAIPYYLGRSFDDLRALGDGAGPQASSGEVERMLLWSAGSIVLLAALVAGVRTTSRLFVLGVSRRAVHDVRNDLFDHLLRLSPSFYVRHQTGQIMSRAVNDMRNVQGLLGPVFMYLAETAVLYVAGVTFMCGVDPVLTLAALSPFPFFIWMARRLARRIQVDSRAAQDRLGEVSAKVDESLSGHQVIKTLALEEREEARFAEQCEQYRALNLRVTRARSTLSPLMLALASLSTAITLGVGGPRVAAGEMSLGELVSMLFYLQMVAAPTGILGFVISSLERGTAALARLREVFEMEPTLTDPSEPSDASARVPAASESATLKVEGLTLVHRPLEELPHLSIGAEEPEREEEGAARTVLDQVTFEVAAGTTLGIVGHTGSGKSSLLAALARQLEVEPGTIWIGGTDVCDLPVADLRRRIGYVPQETFLFSRSLADNVALGRPQAERSEVEAAVRAASLDKDLDQLPDGLDTLVGERGLNLSGGQRQRTALARVMLLEPSILLLDDCLSAVDTQTADDILGALAPKTEGRTTVIAAHRIATVRHADQILVLEEGRIVERGDHESLVRAGGRYARLHERQRLTETMSEELGLDEDGAEEGA